MVVARRLKFGLVVLAALVGATIFALPAGARTIPDPFLANIPYLAWRGEQVRVLKCEPALAGLGLAGLQGEFMIVDRSGDPHLTAPQQVFGAYREFIRPFDGAPCFSTVFESNKA